jgi:tyrosine-protein kinase Etk/Wzc
MGEPPRKIDDILSGSETHFLDYLIILAKHSRTIIYPCILVVVLVYLIQLILPNKYTATARLLSPQLNMTMSAQILNSLDSGTTPRSSGNAGGAGGLGGMAAGLLGLKTTGDLYVGLMAGDTISDRIIERFNLRKVYNENYIEEARKTLGKKVKINVGRKDGIISIEVTDKDRIRSANIANAFVEELNGLLQNLAVREAKDRLTFLDKERLQADLNLAKAEDALRDFSEKNSVIQIDTQAKEMLLYIARLRAEIDSKEVQIQVMRLQATPNNYDVVRLKTEVTELKNKLQTSEKQYGQICAGNTCLPTSEVPALGLEYVRLYREIKFQEGLCQFYKKMTELARLDVVKDFAVAQVVDQALPPEKRSNRRMMPALLSGIATFFVMVFYVFGQESLQNAQLKDEQRQRLALLKYYLHSFSEPIYLMFSKIRSRNPKDRQN